MSYNNHFQVGGTLGSNNNSYVVRQADKILLNYLLEGNFCFVLNSRQMGKSSLMVKTANKLINKKISCAFSDLSVLGITEISSEQWYKSFAYQLLESLDLDEIDLYLWWEKHSSLTPVKCLEKFFENIILAKISSNIVIFVDEIDSIIRLPFKDDFFALIRGFYNKRTINNEYQRLTFCLLGVATPSDLIENKIRTPFNIGYPIELSGFTLEEAKNALIPGFPKSIKQPEAILIQILKWTGGQPFLTQKLCSIISQHSDNEHPNVNEIVRKYIIDDWESQDYPQHFKTISDRLLFNPNYTLELLELYKNILLKKDITANDSLAQNQLKISGLVRKKGTYLEVYNSIYEKIFNLNWIEEQLNNIRPYSSQLYRWINSNYSNKYLLNENELIKALEWAKDKNIASEDHRYLSASSIYEIQQKAKNEILIAQRKKNEIIVYSKRILLTTIAITGAVISGTTLFANNKGYQAIISMLERDSNIALQEFEQGEQIKGLSEAIFVSSQLNNRTKNNKDIANYSTVKPIVAINNIINQIEEKNAVKISDSAIKQAYYNSQGQLVAINKEGTVILFDGSHHQIFNEKLLEKDKVTKIAISSNRKEAYVVNKQKKYFIIVIDRSNNYQKYFETNDIVNSIAISSDGKYIIYGNNSGEIITRSIDGRTTHNWSAHKGAINSIAISPNNNIIATVGYDTAIKLWTKEGKLINTLYKKDIETLTLINSIAFSPDGQTIATAGNNTIDLWNINEGRYLKTLSSHTDVVNSIAFSPDGETIVSASSDGTIKLWYKEGLLRQTIEGNQGDINTVAFHPSGKIFASTSDKGIVKIWRNVKLPKPIDNGVFINKQQLLLNSFQGLIVKNITNKTIKKLPNLENKLINSFAVSPNKNIVIVGTIDGVVASFDLQKPDFWKKFDENYRGKVIAIDIHPLGQKLITLGINESDNKNKYVIKKWSIEGNSIKSFELNYEEEVTAIKYNYQGIENGEAGTYAIATKNGNIELWDEKSNSRKLLVDSKKTDNALENIVSIAFSPNNKLIATANKEGTIQLRTIEGELLATFAQKKDREIVYLDFAADNKTIKAIDRYGEVSDWNLDIDTLINKGCSWLEDYLLTQNNNTETKQICAL